MTCNEEEAEGKRVINSCETKTSKKSKRKKERVKEKRKEAAAGNDF